MDFYIRSVYSDSLHFEGSKRMFSQINQKKSSAPDIPVGKIAKELPEKEVANITTFKNIKGVNLREGGRIVEWGGGK